MILAVDFNPRNAGSKEIRRGATVEDSTAAIQPSLRDGRGFWSVHPWDESHGYDHSSLREDEFTRDCAWIAPGCEPLHSPD